MTEPDPNDRGAIHSALNDTDFPDDERGLTGTSDDVRGETGATGPEGQTARDVFPEDDGVPDVSQDDFPTMQRSEDPQFAPELGDRESHQTVDFGTTAFEQSEGESLSGRLERELPDDAPTMQELSERAEAQSCVRRALSRLSDEHRQVLLLRYMKELDYGEIAAALEVSEGTVKSRINRAKARLRELLTDTGNLSAAASVLQAETVERREQP